MNKRPELIKILIVVYYFLLTTQKEYYSNSSQSQTRNLREDSSAFVRDVFKPQRQKHHIPIQSDEDILNPIRITHNISSLRSELSHDLIYLNKFIKLINTLELFLQNFIKVNPEVENNILVEEKTYACSDEFDIENEETNGIIDSDLHIFYKVVNEPYTAYLAYSAICSFSRNYKRPNFGIITLNSRFIQLQSHFQFHRSLQTLIHETFHIIGFNIRYFELWRDSNQQIYNYQILKEKHIRGRITNITMTPNVVATAKKYYNCSQLEGMQLENIDRLTAKNNHWEASILFEDLLQPRESSYQAISVFTIAFLQDTGFWGQVNENFATPIFWGRNKGCQFFYGLCERQEGQQNLNQEFIRNKESGCNFSSTSKATKNSVDTVDYCEVMTSEIKGNCQDEDNYQENEEYKQYQFEDFSFESKCFNSNIQNPQYERNEIFNSVCYRFECSENHEKVIIKIAKEINFSIECSLEQQGEIINAEYQSFFIGQIQCPQNYEIFCTNRQCRNFCSSNGFCINSLCHCLPGYSGEDCSNKTDKYQYLSSFYDIYPEDSFLNPDNTCKKSCPKSYYADSHQKKCIPCDFSCSKCSGPSSNDCTECQYLTYLFNNTCMSICPIGFYGNEKTMKCYICENGCQICLGKKYCLECAEGYTLIRNICSKSDCQQTNNNNLCKRCTSDKTQCVECYNNQFLDETQMKCLSHQLECPNGTYGDYHNNLCAKCSEGCLRCAQKQYCTECDSIQGFRLVKQQCVQCDFPCLQCEDSLRYRNKCLECEEGYNLVGKSCVKQ